MQQSSFPKSQTAALQNYLYSKMLYAWNANSRIYQAVRRLKITQLVNIPQNMLPSFFPLHLKYRQDELLFCPNIFPVVKSCDSFHRIVEASIRKAGLIFFPQDVRDAYPGYGFFQGLGTRPSFPAVEIPLMESIHQINHLFCGEDVEVHIQKVQRFHVYEYPWRSKVFFRYSRSAACLQFIPTEMLEPIPWNVVLT